jgi:dsRNA-specific ribonuclease
MSKEDDLGEAFGATLKPEMLERALTHRSYAYEHGGLPTNERLEFLGDSVLGLVVTATLYDNHPDLPEGKLAKLRASVVNARALAGVARNLGTAGIGPHLLLRPGRGAHRRPRQRFDPRRHVRGPFWARSTWNMASRRSPKSSGASSIRSWPSRRAGARAWIGKRACRS